MWQLLQCCRIADDDGLLAAGSVTCSLSVQSLSDSPGWGHHLSPVVCNVLVIWVMRALQLLGANVAEHDAKCEEAEHPNNQKDVHHALRLSVSFGCSHVLHSMLGGVVLRCERRQYICAVEAVL